MHSVSLPKCDHTSVAALVYHDDALLLIKRQKPPYGYAPPAGHIDHHGSAQDAAIAELYEEVGLRAVHLELVASGIKGNRCRRQNGTWHKWQIFKVAAEGTISTNPLEVALHLWASPTTLNALGQRTITYLDGAISHSEWRAQPGLEVVWLEWLTILGILRI